jgi:hypothetical protein
VEFQNIDDGYSSNEIKLDSRCDAIIRMFGVDSFKKLAWSFWMLFAAKFLPDRLEMSSLDLLAFQKDI